MYVLTAKQLNRRLYGWLLKLLDFTFSVEYRPGIHHQDADGLSRQAWNTTDFGSHLDFIPISQPRAAESSLVGGDVGISPQDRQRRSTRDGGGGAEVTDQQVQIQ